MAQTDDGMRSVRAQQNGELGDAAPHSEVLAGSLGGRILPMVASQMSEMGTAGHVHRGAI